MKILYSWLVEFFEPAEGSTAPAIEPSPREVDLLVDALNSLGMVVESVERVPTHLEGVVVADVVQIDEIEGADHIRQVLVRAGEENPIEIVCGATNFAVGDRVPLAQVGAVLPGEFRIQRRTMMGRVSNGMLCSERELELSDDSAGLMILPPDASPGESLSHLLGLHEEVVIDLAIEANRPDANSVLGVARDVAPALGFTFRLGAGIGSGFMSSSDLYDPGRYPQGDPLLGEVDATLAPRMVAAKFEGPFGLVDPFTIRRRLQLCGMRSISPVVDASNYVMIETGQPTHPYDLQALTGSTIGVRRAKVGESLKTLDGEVRLLQGGDGEFSGDIVIVDATSTPVGLAGVMGGDSSVITEKTTSVLLELACFPRSSIAMTSKRLGLRSEASARFERGVDPNVADWALRRFCELLDQEPLAVDSAGPTRAPAVTVQLRLAQVERLLGRVFEVERIRTLLEPFGFLVGEERDATTEITVPSFRPDCSVEADIVEEIARHEGYRSLGERRIQSPYVGKLTPYQRDLRQISDFLVSRGYFELMGSALVSSDDGASFGLVGPSIRASNPLSADESVLRRTLLSSALGALRFNAARRRSEVAFFEIGEVFSMPLHGSMLPDETTRLAVLATSPENGVAPLVELLADLSLELGSLGIEIVQPSRAPEAVVAEMLEKLPSPGSWPELHTGRSGLVVVDGSPCGIVGELKMELVRELTDGLVRDRVGWLELDLSCLAARDRRPQLAQELSHYTSTDLDLAFELEIGVPALELCRCVERACGPLARSVELFDVFSSERLGPMRRSLAVRIRLESTESTVSEVQLAEIIQRVDDAVKTELGGVLRRS